jgi:serine/threonine protein kinase
MFGVAAGLAYSHQMGIVHRDVKSENILVDDGLRPKVGDFGGSAWIGSADMKMGFGTPGWVAPEVVWKRRPWTEKIDVYSYGWIVWEVATGRRLSSILVRDVAVSQAEEWQVRGTAKFGFEGSLVVPGAVEALIRACLKEDPQQRPSFAMILRENSGDTLALPGTDPAEFLEYQERVLVGLSL